MEKMYTCETWLHGEDGENVTLANEERNTPFPLYQIGTKVTVEGATPKSYTVRQNYVGGTDSKGFPLRQTLVVN
jgi:ribosomal protein S6E (S10)